MQKFGMNFLQITAISKFEKGF